MTSGIRPATAADRETVVAFCATVWDGNDYIDRVFNEWLAEGGLFVGEEQPGKAIALVHLERLPDGGSWLQGLRVDPVVRRRGWGRRMVEFGIEWARAQGVHSLSLLTSTQNQGMRGIAEQLGFELILKAQWYRRGRPERIAAPILTVAGPDVINLAQAALLQSHHGLYARGWSFWRLTPGLLEQHLTSGEVLLLPDTRAWAIVAPDDLDEPLLAHIEGAETELSALLDGLWSTALLAEAPLLRAIVPVGGVAERAVVKAGFERWDEPFLVYEHKLSSKS